MDILVLVVKPQQHIIKHMCAMYVIICELCFRYAYIYIYLYDDYGYNYITYMVTDIKIYVSIFIYVNILQIYANIYDIYVDVCVD